MSRENPLEGVTRLSTSSEEPPLESPGMKSERERNYKRSYDQASVIQDSLGKSSFSKSYDTLDQRVEEKRYKRERSYVQTRRELQEKLLANDQHKFSD